MASDGVSLKWFLEQKIESFHWVKTTRIIHHLTNTYQGMSFQGKQYFARSSFLKNDATSVIAKNKIEISLLFQRNRFLKMHRLPRLALQGQKSLGLTSLNHHQSHLHPTLTPAVTSSGRSLWSGVKGSSRPVPAREPSARGRCSPARLNATWRKTRRSSTAPPKRIRWELKHRCVFSL